MYSIREDKGRMGRVRELKGKGKMHGKGRGVYKEEGEEQRGKGRWKTEG